ncbi:hypothetical protein DYB28_000172 [Aphanomyces astaci]|uniref:EF-hand domain-containing protein n=1 Tax=Aphanomyces astaci TaxID=112090 RepID=A0A397EJF3_APHAT|nr:hypothetical protein DYB30_001507 [Aphanomyces astaci]RHY63486.1 hypothetical protein DYB38_001318 [Aphanomyces astaci]RHY81888.1 hypothetical protein DYB31_010712 [Aphanomyces astaci]RHY87545.1 hypothetical protein DYB26_004124 [Aphanomyces astaci]RLO01873.1 hypothetical protein DYB28_000172 [Aphanomyces astaci]
MPLGRSRLATSVQATDLYVCVLGPCEALLLTLQLHLTERRISVLDLFGQTDRVGDGSVSVSALRSILFHLDLGWTQHDITLLVRAMDPHETGVILPITVESLLRKLQQPHLGTPAITPQPSPLLRY